MLEQMQSLGASDCTVSWVEFSGPCVGVGSVPGQQCHLTEKLTEGYVPLEEEFEEEIGPKCDITESEERTQPQPKHRW